MDPLLLARAFALGFTIAAAVGPISLLTIRRTLAHGQAYGLASGLGVAAADGTYAAIAAFGLTAVTSVLVGGRLALGVVGGAFLVLLGIRTFRSRPRAAAADDGVRPGLPAAFASIYALTMTNPMTILSFAGLFAALGVTTSGGVGAATVTGGVVAGSMAWWVVLTSVVARLRTRVTVAWLAWVNRVSGAVVALFGVAAITGAVAGR
jgi:threonine/homoserine/homoserine lactone efflux protein